MMLRQNVTLDVKYCIVLRSKIEHRVRDSNVIALELKAHNVS